MTPSVTSTKLHIQSIYDRHHWCSIQVLFCFFLSNSWPFYRSFATNSRSWTTIVGIMNDNDLVFSFVIGYDATYIKNIHLCSNSAYRCSSLSCLVSCKGYVITHWVISCELCLIEIVELLLCGELHEVWSWWVHKIELIDFYLWYQQDRRPWVTNIGA